MKHVVLDTNVVVKDPGLLRVSASDIRLIVTDLVRHELDGLISSNRVPTFALENVLQASTRGFIFGDDATGATTAEERQRAEEAGLSSVDYRLAVFVEHLLEEGKEAYLATEDRDLLQYAQQRGIPTLRLAELQREFAFSNLVRAEQLKKDETVQQYRRRYLLWGILLGVVVSATTNLAIENLGAIVRVVSLWGALASLPIVALFFYWLRSRYPLGYGLVEVSVGLASAGKLLLPGSDYLGYGVAEVLQIFVGVYIVVRGLDNISRGISGTWVESWWTEIFGTESTKRAI